MARGNFSWPPLLLPVLLSCGACLALRLIISEGRGSVQSLVLWCVGAASRLHCRRLTDKVLPCDCMANGALSIESGQLHRICLPSFVCVAPAVSYLAMSILFF